MSRRAGTTAGPAVPTWNYAAVHAYGTVAHDPPTRTGCATCVRRLSERHEAREAGAVAHARTCRRPISQSMLKGIVGDRDRGQPARGQIQAEPEPPGGGPAAHHRRARTAGRRDLARGGRADARARDGGGVRSENADAPHSKVGMTFRATRFALPGSAAAGSLRLERDRGERPDARKSWCSATAWRPGSGCRPRQSFPGAARGAAARRRASTCQRRQCRPVGRHDRRRPGAARLVAGRQARSRDPRTRRQRRAARHRPRDGARQSRRDDRQDQGERRQAAARRHAGPAELGRRLQEALRRASIPSLRRRMEWRFIRSFSTVSRWSRSSTSRTVSTPTRAASPLMVERIAPHVAKLLGGPS